MKKFKFNDKEFEMEYENDIAPVLLDKACEGEKVNLEELQKKYPNNKIFSYSTNYYNDEESGKLIPITYYYAGAECINAKKYKHIEEYDCDFPPKDILMEVILQDGRFKRKFYIPIKNSNCSMMDLIDTAVNEIGNILFDEVDEEEEYTLLDLYDDGGWRIDVEIGIDEEEIQNYISSIRLVEEVKE